MDLAGLFCPCNRKGADVRFLRDSKPPYNLPELGQYRRTDTRIGTETQALLQQIDSQGGGSAGLGAVYPAAGGR